MGTERTLRCGFGDGDVAIASQLKEGNAGVDGIWGNGGRGDEKGCRQSTSKEAFWLGAEVA